MKKPTLDLNLYNSFQVSSYDYQAQSTKQNPVDQMMVIPLKGS